MPMQHAGCGNRINCSMMNGKTIEWGELEDGGDDCFQDSLDRLSSAVPIEPPASSASEDEGYGDGRLSFVSAVATPSRESNAGDVDRGFDGLGSFDATEMSEYQMWMADPRSVRERRRKLLQGMGLFGSREELMRLNSSELHRNCSVVKDETFAVEKVDEGGLERDRSPPDPRGVASPNGKIVRSKSAMARFEGGLDQGKIETLGQFSRLPLVCRNASAPSCLYSGCVENRDSQFSKGSSSAETDYRCDRDQTLSSPQDFCKIKNLDTGKEFVVNELKEDGTWNYLSDIDTGEQLTMEEFERCVGYSPIVKELLRRENFVSDATDNADKLESTALKSKSLLSNAKKKAAWLKNIKGVASSVSGLIGDKERDGNTSYTNQSNQQSPWTRVRQHGKSYKELTGLYLSQEIQAHEGCIWSMRFSLDGRYLASAGADKVIHIWQVLECETILSVPEDAHLNLLRSSASHQCDRFSHMEHLSIKKNKKGKISSSSNKCSIQDYVVVPKTMFSLSKKPMCSLQGHLDDVLDLSWSKSQQLLSSSMDKTVRLWDLESKTCLKLFAHNDYVTCIQFNPVDERYFISGSLDSKVRIWSIPDHKVVDWSDFHEMVTAACYTPDGQGALVGSHKGTCRLYDTSGCKLSQNGQIDIYKKKQKGRAKKITGFQFSPLNSSEVMITSADSQIRVFEGTDRIQKFRGLQNTSSQIAASFTPDGKYVVCASEDSQVYVWKHDDLQTVSANIVSGNGGKSKDHGTTRSHEHFICRDVSVAIPWPGIVKYESPYFAMRSRGYKNQSASSRQSSNQQPATLEDAFTSSRSHLPPLPENDTDQLTNIHEDFANLLSCMESDASGNMSFDSTMSSRFDGLSNNAPEESFSSSSSSSLLSSRWLFNGNHTTSSSTNTSTAWGLTLVTAGLGGEIRIYHNFGLPLRLQNQSFSLFGGLRQEAHAT